MISGIQIIGIVFLVIMIYFTFVYYRRNDYGYRSLILWMIVWVGGIFLVSYPATTYGLMETLQIERTADFFVLIGFAFFATLTFYMYTQVKKNNAKVEELVRKIALQKATKTGVKNKKTRSE